MIPTWISGRRLRDQRQIEQSSATACKSSSRPTPPSKAPVPAGPVASTTSCAACSPRPTGAPSTASARSPSSPCSARSTSTARSDASNAEAGRPAEASGRFIAATHNLLKLHHHRPRCRPRLRRGRRRRPRVRLAHQIGTSETPPRDFPTASRETGLPVGRRRDDRLAWNAVVATGVRLACATRRRRYHSTWRAAAASQGMQQRQGARNYPVEASERPGHEASDRGLRRRYA